MTHALRHTATMLLAILLSGCGPDIVVLPFDDEAKPDPTEEITGVSNVGEPSEEPGEPAPETVDPAPIAPEDPPPAEAAPITGRARVVSAFAPLAGRAPAPGGGAIYTGSAIIGAATIQ